MKNLCIPMLAMLAVYFSLGCAGVTIPTPTPTVETSATSPKAKWEQEWEQALAEARKEGSVTVYTLWRPATRTALMQAFKEKFGINLEFTPFGRGAELVARVQSEQRAGLHAVDVFGAGGGTIIASMKPASLLSPLEWVLIVPEVLDSKRWTGGKIPFVDKDKLAMGMLANVDRSLMVNTDLIKQGEIATFKDLLKPQYKRKITLNDPSISGSGNTLMTFLAANIWNLEESKDFLRQLIREQEVILQRDNRLHVESVARGKFAIGLAPDITTLVEFIKLGAPLSAVISKDGTLVTHASGIISLPPKPSHSNATNVFVNWLLSKEGQTVFSTSWGVPSLRNDVPTKGFLSVVLPQPDEKLFIADEDTYILQGKMVDVNREILELTK